MELIPVCEYNGEAVTTSRAVADQFGKQHQHVIRDIENIISQLNASNFGLVNGTENEGSESKIGPAATEDFAARNFLLSEYTDLKGEKRKQYILTRDGFTLLAMGFTGAKAMQFKVAYITAFNRMEALISGNGSGLLQNTRRAAEQLAVVSDTFTQSTETAANEVAKQTIAAIEKAVREGDIKLRRKFSPPDSEASGSYDDYSVSVRAKAAYTAYSHNTDNPLAYSVWLSFARQATIWSTNVKKIPAHHCTFVNISRSDISIKEGGSAE